MGFMVTLLDPYLGPTDKFSYGLDLLTNIQPFVWNTFPTLKRSLQVLPPVVIDLLGEHAEPLSCLPH